MIGSGPIPTTNPLGTVPVSSAVNLEPFPLGVPKGEISKNRKDTIPVQQKHKNVAVSLIVLLLASFQLIACERRGGDISFPATPSYRPAVLEEFRQGYPEPVSASPDGKRLLMRTLNSDGHPFGLEVIDLKSHQRIARTSLADDPMRLCWRPDSSSVSFFVQPRQKNGRTLHLWRFMSGQDEPLTTPPAKAEPNMKWSPNSRYFAYLESGVGLIQSGVPPALPGRQKKFDIFGSPPRDSVS